MASAQKHKFADLLKEEIEAITSHVYSKSFQKEIKTSEKIFTDFLESKAYPTIPTSKEQLNAALCDFWPATRTMKNEEYTAFSLRTMHQHLRNFLNQKVNVDIVVDVDLKKQRDVFDNYLRSLKAKGKGSVRHFSDISIEESGL